MGLLLRPGIHECLVLEQLVFQDGVGLCQVPDLILQVFQEVFLLDIFHDFC